MMKRIARVESEPGGWKVQVEVLNAHTDGRSRIDILHLPFGAISPASTPDELLAVVSAAHDQHLDPLGPFEAVRDYDITSWAALRGAGIAEPIAAIKGVAETLAGKER